MLQVGAWAQRVSEHAVLDCLWRVQHNSLQVIDKLRHIYPTSRTGLSCFRIDDILDLPVLHPKSEKLAELEGRVRENKQIWRAITRFKTPLTLVQLRARQLLTYTFRQAEETPAVIDWYTYCIGNLLYHVVRATLLFMMVDEDAIDSYLAR